MFIVFLDLFQELAVAASLLKSTNTYQLIFDLDPRIPARGLPAVAEKLDGEESVQVEKPVHLRGMRMVKPKIQMNTEISVLYKTTTSTEQKINKKNHSIHLRVCVEGPTRQEYNGIVSWRLIDVFVKRFRIWNRG